MLRAIFVRIGTFHGQPQAKRGIGTDGRSCGVHFHAKQTRFCRIESPVGFRIRLQPPYGEAAVFHLGAPGAAGFRLARFLICPEETSWEHKLTVRENSQAVWPPATIGISFICQDNLIVPGRWRTTMCPTCFDGS
jgi:hypothetical protein